jgi:hypothetical protein
VVKDTLIRQRSVTGRKILNLKKSSNFPALLNYYRQNDYNQKKNASQLGFHKTLSKCEQSYKKVPWSYSKDGLVRSGDAILITNKKTQGYLVTDIGDKTANLDEAFMVTTTPKHPGPITRSVFVIKKEEASDVYGSDNIIRYG